MVEWINNPRIRRSKKSFESNVNNIKLRLKNIQYNGSSDTRGKNDIQLIELTIPDKLIEDKGKDEDRPLSRIDGNHRLSVAGSSESGTTLLKNTPFCIILIQVLEREYIDEKGNSKPTIDDSNKKEPL